jgi:NAD(P)-dependent dehydrogenase (short-subunit alcohol dehydrogenase family)
MSNLVYIVTGGNRGIGREICKQLAEIRRDSTILLTSRELPKAVEAVNQLGYNNIKAHQLDLNSKDSIDNFVSLIKKEYGVVDVLINNAGYATKGSEVNEKIASDTIGCNFFGLMQLSEALLPMIQSRPDGRIVNVSSSVGELANRYSNELKQNLLLPTLTQAELTNLIQQFIQNVKEGTHTKNGWPNNTYGMSKAAVNSLTRITARDTKNATINCVCPGWVKTDMGGPNATRSVETGAETPIWLAIAPISEIKYNGRFFRDKQLINW